ncbi:MAG: riboflavin biosynthesis protein RibF [Erysipelotrichaceae bacterium]
MQIIEINLEDHFKFEIPITACIGYFDGLHVGHQALIKQTDILAQKYQCAQAMISFDPDPWMVTKELNDVKHINSQRDKLHLLKAMQIDYLIILKFTKEMAALSSEDFVKLLVERLNLKALVTGFDFHYGAYGSGNIDSLALQAEGYFETSVVDAIRDEYGKISSSRIEEELLNGNIGYASKMLGYDYFVQGIVVKGRQKGREIGFPTANVAYDDHILLPKKGVYAGYVKIAAQCFKAIINLGHNPTFNFQEKDSLEVHILDFNQMIYGQHIKVIFVQYIRDEKKFNSVEALTKQIDSDCLHARQLETITK